MNYHATHQPQRWPCGFPLYVERATGGKRNYYMQASNGDYVQVWYCPHCAALLKLLDIERTDTEQEQAA